MFKEIRIQNFQSIEDLTLKDMKKINIILGHNNSGKSSILKAINFPTESYISKKIPIWKEETSISPFLHSFDETIFQKDTNRDLKIKYTILFDETFNFYKKIESMLPTTLKLLFMSDIDKLTLTFEIKVNNKNEIHEFVYMGDDLLYSEEHGKIVFTKRKDDKFIFEGNTSSPDWIIKNEDLQVINYIHSLIINTFKGIYLFITDRKPRDWKVSPKKWDRIGIHGENAVSLLSYIKNNDEKLYNDICNSINKISEDIKQTKSPMNESGEVSIIHQTKKIFN